MGLSLAAGTLLELLLSSTNKSNRLHTCVCWWSGLVLQVSPPSSSTFLCSLTSAIRQWVSLCWGMGVPCQEVKGCFKTQITRHFHYSVSSSNVGFSHRVWREDQNGPPVLFDFVYIFNWFCVADHQELGLTHFSLESFCQPLLTGVQGMLDTQLSTTEYLALLIAIFWVLVVLDDIRKGYGVLMIFLSDILCRNCISGCQDLWGWSCRTAVESKLG